MDTTNDAPNERETSLLLGALAGLAAAKKREGALRNTPSGSKSKHDRNVSWDPMARSPQAQGVPPINIVKPRSDSVDAMSQISAPETPGLGVDSPPHSPKRTSGWSKINVKSIIGASPHEEEAEAYIQRSLEESDPTRSGRSDTQSSILSGVPDDVHHNFSAESDGEMHSSHEATKSNSPGSADTDPIKNSEYATHRGAPTTTETLFGLAADLKKLQSQQDTGSTAMRMSTIMEPSSETNAFAMHAVGISNRMRNEKPPTAPLKIPEAAATPRKGGISQWKKVKQAVDVNGAANAIASEKKKTDDVVEQDDADANCDVEVGLDGVASGDDGEEANKKRMKAKGQLKSNLADFEDFLRFRQSGVFGYVKFALLFLILPATGIAALLFYALDNPPCGVARECLELEIQKNLTLEALNITREERENQFGVFDRGSVDQASISWWLLFIFVRQVITFTFAKMTQALVIDFFCLRSTLSIKLFGPFLTLLVVQSKGWPFLAVVWGINDLCFLYGENSFARQWLFWQDLIDLFNITNPAGDIVASESYLRVLLVFVIGGFAVALKRFWLALFLGRQTFSRYADDLGKVMKKNLLVGQVATLARDMEKLFDHGVSLDQNGGLRDSQAYQNLLNNVNEDGSIGGSTTGPQIMKSMKTGLASVAGSEGFVGSNLTGSQKIVLEQMLGEFEEPKSLNAKNTDIKISDIIQFRQSLSYLNTPFPFSVAFGPADQREKCIKSTEKVFHRLMLNDPDRSALQFDTLALLAVQPDGSLNEDKLSDLVKLFRPDRDGNLTLLDFAKCVDSCYKELRLLRASLANASRIDQSFERIFNIGFYFIAGCIVLAALGIDPLVLFASVSGFILGFAFMIGAACSKYFEGLLLILVRRPYDIGDRIAVSNVNTDTNTGGSTTWFVKDVTLFTTTVLLAATNEVATYSNGSLAASRIINAARSPQAVLFFLLKFPIDTPYEKLKVFKGCLEKFVIARPREWMAMSGFRATRVEADQGFVEYIVVAQHRESWQTVGALLNSKADLSSFALELSKKMNMRYRSPALPVDLSVIQRGNGNDSSFPVDFFSMANAGREAAQGGADGQGAGGDTASQQSMDIGSISAMFDKK